MSIKITIDSTSQFRDQFHRMGRGNSFTYEGYEALFSFLEETSQDSDLELDVIAICCDFSEYSTEELMKEFNPDNNFESIEELLSDMRDSALLLEVSNGNYILSGY